MNFIISLVSKYYQIIVLRCLYKSVVNEQGEIEHDKILS